MTDGQYDILKEYIEEKYATNKVLKEVGAPIHKEKVKLPYYMGSMDKIKPDTNAIVLWKRKYKGPYVLSAKLDGISALYSTEGGTPKLYTRGNGVEGQDISYMIPFLKLPDDADITIRGELIMSKKTFDEKYKKKAANARNLVAGISNRKAINKADFNAVDFVAYEVLNPILKTSDQMKMLEKMNVIPVIHKTVKEVTNELLSKLLISWRDSYDYEIDGVIFANDAKYPRKKENPKHAVAFKMVLSEQIVEAKVVDVIWTPSKDGYLKPRIRIEPVTIGGARIEYATAFNAGYVEENKIGIGAVIQLIRSGDVIPHILKVITPASKAKMPDVPYVWNDTHVDIMLKDASSDAIVQEKNIANFFIKLNVTGLSIGNVRRVIKGGYTSVPMILKMTEADFLEIDGFKEKLAKKIHTSIHAKLEEVSLGKLMAATNIFGRGMGERRINAVLAEYPKILLSKKSKEEKIKQLASIKGFATKTAMAFVDHIDTFMKFVVETGLQKKIEEKVRKSVSPKNTSHPLYGKRILLTGFRDKALEEQLKKLGVKIATSVSKNTHIVIVVDLDEDTGKADKARTLGIPLILVEEFKKKYKI